MGSSSNRYAPRLPQQEAKSSTKLLAPTDPILGPENLLKTGFAQKGLPSITGGHHPVMTAGFLLSPFEDQVSDVSGSTQGLLFHPFRRVFFAFGIYSGSKSSQSFSNSSTNFPALVDVKGVAGPNERKSQPGRRWSERNAEHLGRVESPETKKKALIL